MSRLVDERVVEMSFDNKQFEKNIKVSRKTIGNLKDSLDFSGTAKSINRELNGVNVNLLSSSILNAKQSFGVFEVAAITSIANITNKIVNLGIEMAKALTIDNVTAGWSQMDQSTNFERQLTAQGNTEQEIKDSFKEILWYTNSAAYSYANMLESVVGLTNSGMSLNDAVEATIGFANLAATEGKNVNDMSNIMDVIQKTMTDGVLNESDFDIIKKNGMASDTFRDLLIKAAYQNKDTATLVKNIDGTFSSLVGDLTTFYEGDFASVLENNNIITKEILQDVLSTYAGATTDLYSKVKDNPFPNMVLDTREYIGELDPVAAKYHQAAMSAYSYRDAIDAVKAAMSTGWMTLFQALIGPIENIVKLWTTLREVLTSTFVGGIWDKIKVLNLWADNDGRLDLFENTEENTGAFWNLYNAIVAIKNIIGTSWASVFGFSELEDEGARIEASSNSFKTFTSNLKKWTGYLTLSSETSESLSDALGGLLSVLKMIWQAFTSIVIGLSPLLEVLQMIAKAIIGVLGKIGKKITNFSKSTTFFSGLTKTLTGFSKSFVNFVKSFKVLDGIKIFIDSFRIAFNKALGNTDAIETSGSLIKKIVDMLSKAFKWLATIVNKYIIPYLPKMFELLGKGLGFLIGHFLILGKHIKNIVIRIREWAKTNVWFQNTLLKLKELLRVIGKALKDASIAVINFFKSFKKKNTDDLDEFVEDAETIEKKLTPLQLFLQGLANLFQGLWAVIKAILPVIGQFFSFIGKALGEIGNRLKKLFVTKEGKIDFQKIFTVGFWAVVAVGITRFAYMLRNITKVFTDVFHGLFEVFNSLAMKQYMEAIKIMSISILMLVGALLILGSIDDAALKKSMLALSALVSMIVAVMLIMKKLLDGNVITQMVGTGPKRLKQIVNTTRQIAALGVAFMGLGLAVLMLTVSLKMITKLDPSTVWKSLGIIATLMVMLIVVMKTTAKADKDTNKAIASMVKVAISVALLARPLKKIGEIDPVVAERGLKAIATLMWRMTIFALFSRKMDKSQKAVVSVTAVAVSLNLLIFPLKKIGKMRWGEIQQSLNFLGIIFVTLAALSIIIDLEQAWALNDICTALIKVSVALSLFAIGLMIFKYVDWPSILKGIFAVGSILIALAVASRIMGPNETRNVSKMAWSLIPMSLAFVLFSKALSNIGNIPLTSLIKAITIVTRLSFLITIFIVVMTAMDASGRKIALISVGIMLLAGAMLLFSVALIALGNIPFGVLIIGLAAVAALLIIFGVAVVALGALIIPMLALSGAMLMFAVAIHLLVLAFLSIAAISAATAAAFGIGLIAMAAAIEKATPAMVHAMQVLAEGLIVVFISMLSSLREHIPEIIEELLAIAWAIIDGFFKAVVKYFDIDLWNLDETYGNNPLFGWLWDIAQWKVDAQDAVVEWFDWLFGKIGGWFEEVWGNITGGWNDIIDASFLAQEVIEGFFVGLWVGIKNIGIRIWEWVEGVWDFFLAAFKINSPSERSEEIGDNIIAGLLKGLWDGIKGLGVAIGNWCKDVWQNFKDGFKKAKELGKELLADIKEGFNEKVEDTKEFIQEKAEVIVEGFNSGVAKAKEIGGNVVDGLKTGLEAGGNAIKGAAEKVGGFLTGSFNKVFKINSPSKVFAEIGKQLDMGLVQGIEDNADKTVRAAEGLGDDTVEGLEQSGLSKVLMDLVSSLESDFDNEIVLTPVLDLSKIQEGKNELYSMMHGVGDVDDYSIDGSRSLAGATRDDINRKIRVRGNNNVNDASDRPSDTTYNTFNISGSNPKEIAEEVSRVLQSNIERRNAKWAL